MRKTLALTLLSLIGILAFSFPLFAWDEEILNGRYSYQSKRLTISFDWRLNGISNLRINSQKYDDRQVFLEKFGDIECYQIRVQESPTKSKIIRIVFLLRKENVEFVSGYFADLTNLSQDGDFRVSSVRAIVLRHTKFSPGEVK